MFPLEENRPLETETQLEKGSKITNLDDVIGLCRFCGKTLGESPPPTCAGCTGQEKRRVSHTSEKNPYSKTWNSVDDEEGELLNWVKNGTLFVPTWEELARRHMSKARYLLAKTRSHGRTAEGISVFKEALIQRSMAKDCIDRQADILLKSR